MAVIDMVMKGLEHCKNHDGTTCPECPYFHDDCVAKLCADALELLKEQKERITVLEEEAKTKCTPQKVLNRKELADLIVGECPLCGALFNKEICPTSCGWCGCLLDWKDGEQE